MNLRERLKLGDPSTIKHVFLIVKENRTYDQVFGDDPRGNGNPALAQYGENVTPNQHALAKQFGLYDNTYDIGTNSAEGHNWLMQADDPEYTESSAGDPASVSHQVAGKAPHHLLHGPAVAAGAFDEVDEPCLTELLTALTVFLDEPVGEEQHPVTALEHPLSDHWLRPAEADRQSRRAVQLGEDAMPTQEQWCRMPGVDPLQPPS